MASSAKAALIAGLDPLKDILTDILSRLESLENAVHGGGGGGGPPFSAAGSVAGGQRSPVAVVKPNLSAAGLVASAGGEVPSVKAYDAYMKASVVPLCKVCDDLEGLETMGPSIMGAWEGVRTVIVLASRSKAPTPDQELAAALTPYLGPTQKAVKQIRDLKLDRDWDRHYKAVVEALACLSWILFTAPKQLPSTIVKESLSGAEFWSNRIRKDYKGKDDTQIEFCNALKQCLTGLVEYVEGNHKTGLTWNPRGVSLAEAAIRLSDEPAQQADQTEHLLKSPMQKRHPSLGGSKAGSNIAGLMGELSKRQSKDGSSAATGLKHVARDQQTWRKEYKPPETTVSAPKKVENLPPVPSLDDGSSKHTAGSKKGGPAGPPTKKKSHFLGIPIFEYQDRGFKWVIENHNKDSVVKEVSQEGYINVDVGDPKQQVYIYNCVGITVKIQGKFKSLILDKCQQCNVVFDTLISSAELVNCKKVQIQVDGVCPVFTIDKTTGVLVWLSEASMKVSTITTSQSSEMNVSFQDGDEQKECPIPEQFVHKLEKGTITSDVSDLYH